MASSATSELPVLQEQTLSVEGQSARSFHIWLPRLFVIGVTLSSLLWSYAVLTTSIDDIDLRFLPMFSLMPIAYWVGWGLLVVATITWYISPKTEPVHFLLAPLWLLFIIIGPEIIQVVPRGSDVVGHIRGLLYYDNGLYRAPYVGYSAFPSFHFLLISLQKLTGLELIDITKLAAVVFHGLRLIATMFLAAYLFRDRKRALFFALVLTALFWDETNLDPSNQSMGMVFVLFLLGVLLVRGISIGAKRLILLLIFAGVTTTHPLSALVIFIIFGLFYVARLAGRVFDFGEALKNVGALSILLLFGVVTGAWIFYSSDWVFAAAVQGFVGALGLGGSLTQIGPVDPLAGLKGASGQITFSRFAILVYAFFGLLFIWGLAIVSRIEFWRKLDFQTILPVLCVIALGLTQFAGIWSIPRIYLISAPFIAWFFADQINMRRSVAIGLVLVLLLYAFTLRYHSEAVKSPPSAEYASSQFIVAQIPHAATIAQGVRYGPDFLALAEAIEGPGRADLVSVAEAQKKPGVDFQYAILSDWGRRHVVFYWPLSVWESANFFFFQRRTNIIYADGFSEIHAY